MVFGLIMGRLLYRQFAALRHAMGPGSREALQTTARGAWRGPLPEDPAAREAALRLARYQLGELRRRRTVTYAVFAVALALETWLALTSSPWFWLAVAMFGLSLVVSLAFPRVLRRRIELLQQ
jgi:hypothetical protein